MATDWFATASWYRYLALPVPCVCDQIYTVHKRPPWYYLTQGFPVTEVEWWDFIDPGNRLLPPAESDFCQFVAASIDPFSGDVRAIQLVFTVLPVAPFTHHATLALKHDTLLSQQRVQNQIDLTALYGARLPRGQGLSFPHDNWVTVHQTFPPADLPDINVECTPGSCLANWVWGEPLPPVTP